MFDLNADAAVDMQDLDQWLADAGDLNVGAPFLYGDANLDGLVDGQDFVIWNANKFNATAAWCAADFNADGFTDGQDYIIWNSNKFQASDLAFSAVPEPASMAAWLVLAGAVLLPRRRFVSTA
jgi:uncharacterized protein (TIGR03382 family)